MGYKYVSKKEYSPTMTEIKEIIDKVHNDLRKEKITFQEDLIGSGKKHLVTELENGNKGFDFDYNLTLEKTDTGDANIIRPIFFKFFQKAIKNTRFNKIENSKTTITIIETDKKNSKRIHSCDFGIVKDCDENNENQKIIVFDKKNNRYIWNERPSSGDYKLKATRLKENNYWEEVREVYLYKKNRNTNQDKKSYQLYIETINELYEKKINSC